MSLHESQLEMHISRREIEKREIGDREISREKWGTEKSRKKSSFLTKKLAQSDQFSVKMTCFPVKISHFS